MNIANKISIAVLGLLAISAEVTQKGALGAEKSTPLLKVIRKIPHAGYSEGLDYHQGYLWNALPKQLVKIDPKDGSVLERLTPGSEYSESLKWIAGVLWHVSFSDNGIYRGSGKDKKIEFKKMGTTPEVHAWGLEFDGKHLVMTGDYSSKLYFLDPKSLKVVRTLETEAKDVEDLAWDGKVFWASSFTTKRGTVFKIDPKTGKILGEYVLPNIEECPVIDGLATQDKGLWITGKECPSLYFVERP